MLVFMSMIMATMLWMTTNVVNLAKTTVVTETMGIDVNDHGDNALDDDTLVLMSTMMVTMLWMMTSLPCRRCSWKCVGEWLVRIHQLWVLS